MSDNKNTDSLVVGDIIEVCNPLRKKEYSFYIVYKIEGNKAYTKFRNFNKRVQRGKFVFEFGKRRDTFFDNGYTVHRKDNNDIPKEINIQ